MNDILQHAPPEENKVRYLPQKVQTEIREWGTRCQAIYIILFTLTTTKKPPPPIIALKHDT